MLITMPLSAGCVDTIDVGETSYGMVLADDLDNNGFLDLLMVTMNGNVVAFDTRATYQPLKTWTAQVHGHNCFVARYGTVGVYATKASRTRHDIRGQQFAVQFTIVDTRAPVKPGGRVPASVPLLRASGNAVVRGPYKVSVMLRVRTVCWQCWCFVYGCMLAAVVFRVWLHVGSGGVHSRACKQQHMPFPSHTVMCTNQ